MKCSMNKAIFAIALSLCLMGGACSPHLSRVQLWQQGKERLDLSHNYALDSTNVPPSTSFVRIHQEGFTVEKPFPILYFSDKWIEVNTVLFETDAVMSVEDLRKVVQLSKKQQCDASNYKAEEERIVIDGHFRNIKIKCSLNRKQACSFLKDLTFLDFAHEFSYNLKNVDDLVSRLACSN